MLEMRSHLHHKQESIKSMKATIDSLGCQEKQLVIPNDLTLIDH